MFALNRLKEQSLRRLYKFILKRVIGQYLESELVLEQLTVESRTGLVSLKNLRFNCKLLNELLQGMPFQIVSAEVAELQATISYDTLMADGCNLTAKGCKIVFAPVEPPSATSRALKKHSTSSTSAKAPSSESSGTKHAPAHSFASEEEGEDPLLFIAQWIEVVIARLQCTVEDLEIILVSHPQLARKFSGKEGGAGQSSVPPVTKKHHQAAAAAASVHLLFDTISFYNTHPKMLQQDFNASTIASTSHMLGSRTGEREGSLLETDISLLSFRKLLSVKSIRVEVKTHTHSAAGTFGSTLSSSSSSASSVLPPLLHFTEGGQIEMMLQPPPQKRRSTFVNSGGRAGEASHSKLGHGHSQSLAHNQAALDVEITFPKLVCNLQASQAPILLAVANSFVDGKAEQVRAFSECAASSPAGAAAAAARAGVGLPPHLQHLGLGADMQQLQQGLQSLHQRHTLHHLEELGAAFRGHHDESEDGGRLAAALGGPVGEEGDEVDFGRLTDLLQKYQLTREMLTAEDRARRAAAALSSSSSSSRSERNKGACDEEEKDVSFSVGSPVESDGEDFPGGQKAAEDKGYDFDSDEDAENGAVRKIGDRDSSDNDDDDFHSGMFYDTAEGASATSSMAGKSRTSAGGGGGKRSVLVKQKGVAAASRDRNSRQSTYGGQSMSLTDSSMFQSTINASSSARDGHNHPSGDRRSLSAAGDSGGVADCAAPPVSGSGGSFFRLFVDSTEVVYQDDRLYAQHSSSLSTPNMPSEVEDGGVGSHHDKVLQQRRAEGDRLVLQLDSAVMTFSAPVASPSIPAIPSSALSASPAVPKFSAAVSGIVLYERVCVKTTKIDRDSHKPNKVPDMSSLVIPPEPGASSLPRQRAGSTSSAAGGRSSSHFKDEKKLRGEGDEEEENDWRAAGRGGTAVFAGPQLEVRGSLRPLDPATGKGGTVIQVQFQHATSSLCVATILKWVKRLEGVVELQQEAASGLFKLECSVQVRSLEVLLLCDPGETALSPPIVGEVKEEVAPSSLWRSTSEDVASAPAAAAAAAAVSPAPPLNPRKPRFRTDWTAVSTGLGLSGTVSGNARWKRVQSASVYTRPDMELGTAAGAGAGSSSSVASSVTPPGSVRIVVVGVTVDVMSTNVPSLKSSFSLHVSSINGFLRLSSPYLPVATPSTTFSASGAASLQGYFHTYELGFLSMRSLGEQRISVTKCAFATADFASHGQQSTGTSKDVGKSGHVGSGLKQFDEIIEINTQIVRADLRSLELNAFVGIITGIVPTPPAEAAPPSPRQKSERISSHNSRTSAPTSKTSGAQPKPPSFLALRIFSHILSARFAPDCIDFGPRDNFGATKKDVFSYCFSIRQPHFELVSSTTYPGMDAAAATAAATAALSSPASSTQCTYLVKDLYTVAASDLSFFEIPLSQLEGSAGCWGDEQQRDEDDEEEVSAQRMGRGESCRGARFRESKGRGDPVRQQQYHFIPLLHRTSLESAMMGTGITASNQGTSAASVKGEQQQVGAALPGGLGRPKHRALKFTVCMTEEVTLTLTPAPTSISMSASWLAAAPEVSSLSLRNTSFDLCLSDMTYRFDPHSTWFQHFPEIFDPIGSTDIIPGSSTSSRSGRSGGGSGASDTAADKKEPHGVTSSTVSVFGRTRLSLSVNKLLVDCCQPDRTEEQLLRRLNLTHKIPLPSASSTSTSEAAAGGARKRRQADSHSHGRVAAAESRVLLSVGKVSVSSTLVTNSNRVALSASLSDASVRVSNKLLRRPPAGFDNAKGRVSSCIEQSPVDVLGYYIEETYRNSLSGTQPSSRPPSQDLTIDFDSFVDVHGFVLMGALDRCQLQIHLNTPSAGLAAARQRLARDQATMSSVADWGQHSRDGDTAGGVQASNVVDEESNIVPIAVECSAGTAALYGCADSLLVLVDSISHIVDSVNASKEDREREEASQKQLHSGGDRSLSSSMSSSSSSSQVASLPVPSQTALMLSPVSAIRHSFEAAEQHEKERISLHLQALQQQHPSPSTPTAASEDDHTITQKSVSFFFDSPLEQSQGHQDVDGSGVLSNASPHASFESHILASSGASASAGRGITKLQHKESSESGTGRQGDVWGDDIAEFFPIEGSGSGSGLTPSNSGALKIDRATDVSGGQRQKKDQSQVTAVGGGGSGGGGGLVKDANWIHSLQEDMFAPVSSRVGSGAKKGAVSLPAAETRPLSSVAEVSSVFPSLAEGLGGGPVGGLGAAMIEEYYPEPLDKQQSEDEPEFEARYYAQYDYDELDEDEEDADAFEGSAAFAYEEEEGEGENEEDLDDVMSETELDMKRERGIERSGDDHDGSDVSSQSSSLLSGSSSGYSDCSFESQSSDSSTKDKKKASKANEKGGKGSAMWQSWGAMKSVTDLQEKRQYDDEEEMKELVDMSTSMLYRTTLNSSLPPVPAPASASALVPHSAAVLSGSSLLVVDVDTDSEGSVVSDGEVEEAKSQHDEDVMPFVQVHSEGGVDEDHQRAWESMSFYQHVQDAALSDSASSLTLPMSSTKHQQPSIATHKSENTHKSKPPQKQGSGGGEQKAMWYNTSSIKTDQIHPLHMTEPPRDKDTIDDYSRDQGASGECLVTPKVNISVKFSIRVKLFAGQEWADVAEGSAIDATRTSIPAPSSDSKDEGHTQAHSVKTHSSVTKRGKYDNSATIEKHLGGLAAVQSSGGRGRGTGGGRGGAGLFDRPATGRGEHTQTAKNLSLKHQHAGSSSMRSSYRPDSTSRSVPDTAVGVQSYGRRHAHVSRDKADGHTEITLSSCKVIYRLYPHQASSSLSSSSAFNPPVLPRDRYALRVHDMLVSYTEAGRKPKKVLGNWLNPSKPVESHLPLIEVIAVGFDLSSPLQDQDPIRGQQGLEYRMEVAVLPLRCYLDGAYVSFLRGFVDYLSLQQKRQEAREASTYARMQRRLGLVSSAEVPSEKGVTGVSRENGGNAEANDDGEDEIDDHVSEKVRSGGIIPSTVTAATQDKIQAALWASSNPSAPKAPPSTAGQSSKEAASSAQAMPAPPPLTYFQSWKVHPVELKINYSPSPLDFRALHRGDFMQLLNLLSIDSLELSLTKVWLVGVSGAAAGFSKMGEEWVREIYAHQMHRLLSSTGPLRGISSIGTSIHGLLLVPVQEYRAHGAIGVLRGLKRESVSLLKTVTRETLTAGSKVSHFLANTLIDLVTPEGAVPSNRRHREAGGGRGHRNEKQPTGFTDSLDRAYEAVSREVTSTLDTIVVLPFKEYRRTGHAGGALKCVVRAIPVAVLRPTAGAAEALSYTLLGLRNNLDPDQRRDEEDVWNVDVKEQL